MKIMTFFNDHKSALKGSDAQNISQSRALCSRIGFSKILLDVNKALFDCVRVCHQFFSKQD